MVQLFYQKEEKKEVIISVFPSLIKLEKSNLPRLNENFLVFVGLLFIFLLQLCFFLYVLLLYIVRLIEKSLFFLCLVLNLEKTIVIYYTLSLKNTSNVPLTLSHRGMICLYYLQELEVHTHDVSLQHEVFDGMFTFYDSTAAKLHIYQVLRGSIVNLALCLHLHSYM